MRIMKIGLILIATTIAIAALIYVDRQSGETGMGKDANGDESTTSTGKNSEEITIDFFKIGADQNISLYTNFPDLNQSKQLREREKCEYLTSAGYYTPENKNLGLFISEGSTISPFHSSKLLNGFIFIKDNKVTITDTFISGSFDFALQAGPVLLINGRRFSLVNANNESARRIMLGKSESDELYFFAIYKPSALYDGPTMKAVPDIIVGFEEENGVEIVDLINLDGGSASAFLKADLELTELKPIGGYFCVTGKE